MTRESYERAVRDHRFRMEFLDLVDLENIKQYIQRVSYEPLFTDFVTSLDFSNQKRPILARRNRITAKPILIVASTAFIPPVHPTYEDFLSTLIDNTERKLESYIEITAGTSDILEDVQQKVDSSINHLGTSTEEEIRKVIDSLSSCRLELIASRAQLEKSSARGISRGFKEELERRVAHYEQGSEELLKYLNYLAPNTEPKERTKTRR